VTASPLQERHSVAKDYANVGALRELWDYRELFYFLAWRDIKLRYKQTALGVLWVVIQPLFTMLVFTALFGGLAKIPTDGIPRPIFYFSALLPWTYFSSTLSHAGLSLVGNANLLTKIYFPRIILPAAAALSGLLDFLIASVLLAGFIAYYRTPVTWTLVLWPVLIAPLALLALGAGSFLAALNVRYRDIRYAIPFAIQLWLFVTPIIYPSSFVPEQFRWLLALNPLTGIIEAYRHALVPSQAIHWDAVGLSLAVDLAVFLGGVAFFRRAEREFADTV